MYQAGEAVQIKATGEVVTISKVTTVMRRTSYVVFQDGKRMRYSEAELAPYVDREEEIAEKVAAGSFENAEAFQKYAYFRLFSESTDSNLFSYQGNKIIFNPFQYKPLLKFLSIDSDERLLVADEVGVGKTIESGIILDELMSRGELSPTDMVLIVCPSMLCAKWQHELYDKFSMDDFHIHDGKSITYMLEKLRNTGGIAYSHSIVSEQLMRSDQRRELLKACLEETGEPFIRLLVVDECHHYRNPGTNTHKVGALLSACSERVLMLSATPFNLRSDDLYNQLHMLNPALFPERQLFEQLQRQIRSINQAAALARRDDTESRSDLVVLLPEIAGLAGDNALVSDEFRRLSEMIRDGEVLEARDKVEFERVCETLNPIATSFTRTLKRDAISHRVTREALTVGVQLSNAEREIYDDFLMVSLERYRALGISERAFGLILNGLERIAASSIAALKDNVRRFGRMKDDELMGELFGDEEIGARDMAAVHEMLAASYDNLLAKIDALGDSDSKYDVFRDLIEQMRDASPGNPRVIVFSFYTSTLRYLRQRLTRDGYRTSLLFGATPQTTPRNQTDDDGFKIVGRTDVMRAFEDGETDILLVSEVGGEGLDFQFCQGLVNYDLPYNPMRIEQRIGRIDRMGQKADKVVVGSLCVEGTVDDAINHVLLTRIDDAADLVGDLEPIIATELQEIGTLMVTGELTPSELEQRERELGQRIERERRTREEFDEARLELVNDRAFRQEFSDAIDRSRVTPADSMRFTHAFLKREHGCRCKPLTDTSATIHISRDLGDRIKSYLRKTNIGKAGEGLRRIAETNSDITIEFNGNTAYWDDGRLFLKPAGPWIRFIIDYLKALDADVPENAFCAAVDTKGIVFLEQGMRYWLFVYEMEQKGFTDTRTYEYVLVRTDGTDARCLSEDDKRLLLRDIRVVRNPEDVPLESFPDAQFAADDCAESRRQQISDEASARNDVKIGSRIQAIRRQSEARIRMLQDELIVASEQDGLRIRRAIAREQDKAEANVAVLEQKMRHVATYSLDAVCLIIAK